MIEQVKEMPKKRGARRTEAAPSHTLYQKIGGALLAMAGIVFLMGRSYIQVTPVTATT
jgi:hypothetical protein